MKPPASVDETISRFTEDGYVAERSFATAVFLTLRMQRLLFLEDEAGVGKHALALSPDVVDDTLGSLLEYQDDIGRGVNPLP